MAAVAAAVDDATAAPASTALADQNSSYVADNLHKSPPTVVVDAQAGWQGNNSTSSAADPDLEIDVAAVAAASVAFDE